jgi:hypothetical protein
MPRHGRPPAHSNLCRSNIPAQPEPKLLHRKSATTLRPPYPQFSSIPTPTGHYARTPMAGLPTLPEIEDHCRDLRQRREAELHDRFLEIQRKREVERSVRRYEMLTQQRPPQEMEEIRRWRSSIKPKCEHCKKSKEGVLNVKRWLGRERTAAH